MALLVVVVRKFEDDDPGRGRRGTYYMGAATCLFTSWTIATAVGLVIGSQIPDELALAASVDLMTVAMLALSLNSAASRAAAISGAGAAIAFGGLPASSGLVVGTTLGIVAGVVAAGRRT